MPRVIITEAAARGLERCRRFLAEKDREAARRAAQTIARHFALIETNPFIGRPLSDHPDLRELVMPFGNSGYVAFYRHDAAVDIVYVLAFRHQKEAGY